MADKGNKQALRILAIDEREQIDLLMNEQASSGRVEKERVDDGIWQSGHVE